MGAYRILTPYREGPFGVEHINDEFDRRFGGRWQPVLITRNDYGAGLMNGDLGVRLGDTVWFAMADGPRRISAAWLPPHEAAWAMTIHKSQGSEYDRIAVLLPSREGQGRELATRELIFTGLTRARIPVGGRGPSLELFAAEADLRDALTRRAVRFGGLRERLGAAR
jgi:exodeoxyribonuclease V alpha subunit